MPSNTAIGIGIMREIPGLGMRSFEPDQSGTEFAPIQYKCNRDRLDFMAVSNGALVRYTVGQNLPFDVGGTHYSDDAVELLLLYSEQGFIYPAT